MQYTWLVRSSKITAKIFLIFWYHKFLLQSKFVLFVINSKRNFDILSFLLKDKTITPSLLKPQVSIKFSSFLTSNVLASKFKSVVPRNLSIKSSNAVKFFNIKETLCLTLNLFSLVNQTSVLKQFKPHAGFRLFYLKKLNNNDLIFKPIVFIQKWQNLYSFLYNSFYFNHVPFVFSSKFFKKETLALNWFFHPLNISVWRYTSFFFTFYITIYTRKLSFFYKQLKHRGTAYALITDLEFHFKTLFYLQKNKWFTLALVPLNINPWSVTLAVPIGSNDLFIQFFFYKFLVFIQKKSVKDQYLFYKKLWSEYKLR